MKRSRDHKEEGTLRVGQRRSSLRMGRFPLPQDMVEAILLRLPVRSLLRLKAVSAEFRSLISSPKFISNHSSTTNHQSTILLEDNRGGNWCLLRYNPGSAHTPLLEALDKHLGSFSHDAFKLVGSANGLVCLQLFTKKSGCILWNPATRQYKYISYQRDDEKYWPLGFGYHSGIQDDYKLLAISSQAVTRGRPIHVFSLRRGTWREIDCVLDRQLYFYFDYPHSRVVLNGIWYSLQRCRNFKIGVVTFDMDTESFAWVSLPAGLRNEKFDNHNRALSVRNQKLRFFSLSGACELEVWVLDQIKTSSWTKIYTADLSAATICLRLRGAHWQGTRVLLDRSTTNFSGKFTTWSYDLLTSTWIEIHSQLGYDYEACDHVETLVPPFLLA